MSLIKPSVSPTYVPTNAPTYTPSFVPSIKPSVSPTYAPAFITTIVPSCPSYVPTFTPTVVPSFLPSYKPSSFPSFEPSTTTYAPSVQPTFTPTYTPSAIPSEQPSFFRINKLSIAPATAPSVPTYESSFGPTCESSIVPSIQPIFTSIPSMFPINGSPSIPALISVSQDFANVDAADINSPVGVLSLQQTVSQVLQGAVLPEDVHITGVSITSEFTAVNHMRIQTDRLVNVKYDIYFHSTDHVTFKENFVLLLTTSVTSGVFETKLKSNAELNGGANSFSQLTASTAPQISDFHLLVPTSSPTVHHILDSKSSSTGLSSVVYGGIAAGFSLFVILISTIYCCYFRKRTHRSAPEETTIFYPEIYETLDQGEGWNENPYAKSPERNSLSL